MASNAVYENEYENLIISRSEELFPDYIPVPFKTLVESEYGAGKPDFALVEKKYRNWLVGEIELGHHPFRGHVLKQVEIFSNGHYDQSHADFLAKRARGLRTSLLKEMLLGQQPRVLVVVNVPKPDWLPPLRRHDALLITAEVFRSDRNRYILRVNGDELPSLGDVLTVCRIDPAFPRMLIVESPANLGIKNGERLPIEFEGRMSEWARVDTADRVWLTPVKGSPIPTSIRELVLTSSESRRLTLRDPSASKEEQP